MPSPLITLAIMMDGRGSYHGYYLVASRYIVVKSIRQARLELEEGGGRLVTKALHDWMGAMVGRRSTAFLLARIVLGYP